MIPVRLFPAITFALLLPLLTAAHAAELAPKPTLADVIKSSSAADWRPLDPANTLYMELPRGRVVIELAPAFAPRHVENIRTLVREKYFDGLAVIRSQDNWVTQWGDADEKTPKSMGTAKATLPGEFTIPLAQDTHFTRLMDRDGYAPQVGHSNGMPSARDPKTKQAWLAHCYGMVGVGRDNGRRQRQRQRLVRRDRPRPPPPRPQHHRRRPRGGRHAAAVDGAARARTDGLFRQAGTKRADRFRQTGGRCAGSGAQPPGSDAYRQRHLFQTCRGSPA